MAGSILGQGYLAGFGMTIGTVFGAEAARHAGHGEEERTPCWMKCRPTRRADVGLGGRGSSGQHMQRLPLL